jgi:molybdate transport system substrate-binding protein
MIHRLSEVTMIMNTVLWTAALWLAVGIPTVQAADIRVMCSNGLKEVVVELLPAFEKSTGNKVHITYETSAAIMNQIQTGASIDLVIITAEGIDDLIKQGRVTAGSRVDLANSGMALAVRAGERKPDIRSAEALKQSLLSAQSVAITKSGVSGLYMLSVFEQFGIAAQMKPKTVLVESGPVGDVVVKGQAEMGVQQFSELLPVAGIEIVGPLPPGLQRITTFSAGLAAGAKEPAAAKTLVQFLSAPAAVPVIQKKGMEPAKRAGE